MDPYSNESNQYLGTQNQDRKITEPAQRAICGGHTVFASSSSFQSKDSAVLSSSETKLNALRVHLAGVDRAH